MMTQLIEMLLQNYNERPYYHRKKAEYTIRLTLILSVYFFASTILNQFIGKSNAMEMLQSTFLIIFLIGVILLVYNGMVELGINVLLIIYVIKGLSLLTSPYSMQFYSFIFILFLGIAMVHLERYQYRLIHLLSLIFIGLRARGMVVVAFLVLIFLVKYFNQVVNKALYQSEMLERRSATDALTGLYNRRAFDEIFVNQFAGIEKMLLILDLDHFKRINDTWGHNVGDEVLVKLARLLGQSIRGQDVAFRWGGEEFVILLKGVTERRGTLIATRIKELVESYDFGIESPLTISIGALHIGKGTSTELLDNYLRRADRALYKAKEEGRNRVVLDSKFKLIPVEAPNN